MGIICQRVIEASHFHDHYNYNVCDIHFISECYIGLFGLFQGLIKRPVFSVLKDNLGSHRIVC